MAVPRDIGVLKGNTFSGYDTLMAVGLPGSVSSVHRITF